MIWNGLIDTITIGYITYSIAWWVLLTTNIINEDVSSTAGEYIQCILFGQLIYYYPFICLYTLLKRSNEELMEKSTSNQIKNLYYNIDILSVDSKYSKLFYPMFIIHRFVFISIPFIID